jgi:hypothetical protein
MMSVAVGEVTVVLSLSDRAIHVSTTDETVDAGDLDQALEQYRLIGIVAFSARLSSAGTVDFSSARDVLPEKFAVLRDAIPHFHTALDPDEQSVLAQVYGHLTARETTT